MDRKLKFLGKKFNVYKGKGVEVIYTCKLNSFSRGIVMPLKVV
jgi:hypothetical protein